MKTRKFRLPAAVTAVAALAMGLTSVVGATAASAAPVVETKTVTHQCVEDRSWTSRGSMLTLSPDNLTVEYPREVNPGETFTVKVQPGTMRTGGKDTGRMKYDVALPEGVAISNLRIDGGAVGFNNAPVVQRVNRDGNPDANGAFARIWDGAHSVNNGGDMSDSWRFAGNRAGLQVDRDKEWRFPRIAFEVTAPDTAGATITTGLREAGNGPGPANRENRFNTMSMLARANVTDAVYCHADASGRTLTSTRVVERGTETSFADTSTDLEIITGSGPTTLTANVTYADGSPVNEGDVEFDLPGGPRRAPVRDGAATIEHSFPELDDRNPVPHTVTARYLGVPGRTNPSQDTTTVTVNPVPRDQVQATVSLAGEAKVDEADGGTVPVELRATVGAAGDAELADGVEVVFFEGDSKIGSEKTSNGVATLATNAPDEAATRTYRAVVEDFENDTQEVTGAEDTLELTIAPVARTSLALDAGQSVLAGEAATITARYSATPSIPAGTEVIFRADRVRIGTAVVDDSGTATLRHTFDSAGDKAITAVVRERTVDGRRYPAAEAGPETLTVRAPSDNPTETELEYTRPNVDIEADLLTGDTVRFIATVKTGGKPIKEGATVSFFDGDTFLGTAPVDPDTGRAVFDHRFAERGKHEVRAVFNGQEQSNADGVVTDVLEPSTSEPVELDVKAHDIEIDNPDPEPEPEPDPDPEKPTPEPGSSSSSGSWGSSSESSFIRDLMAMLADMGSISRPLLNLLGWQLN